MPKSSEKDEAKRSKFYYDEYFDVKDLREAGIVQDESKSFMDRVQLNCHELVYLFGFSRDKLSYFELTISTVGLDYGRDLSANGNFIPKWIRGRVELLVRLATSSEDDSKRASYTYECEEILNYEEKRRDKNLHGNKNIYKIGCLSLETVLPFSLSRILFNGLMQVEDAKLPPPIISQVRPIKLTISTHPTCDKFYYTEQFQSKVYHRFDQPLMFQGQLETLGGSNGTGGQVESLVMWGAKVKESIQFLENNIDFMTDMWETRWQSRKNSSDCLFAWSQCGQQVHLSRPEFSAYNVKLRRQIEGMVHSSYDYASPVCEGAKLHLQKPGDEPGGKEVSFDELKTFKDFTRDHVVEVCAR